jgi:signal transduction histidine kinase/DNA-binding response OmpR family regulator
MNRYLWIVGVWLSVSSYSQSATNDSPTANDTSYVSRLILRGDTIELPESKRLIYKDALQLAKDLNYPHGILSASIKLSEYYDKTVAVDSTIDLLKSVEPFLKGDEKLLAKLYLELGDNYEDLSKIDSAYEYVNRGMSIAESIPDNSLLVRGNIILGNFELNKYHYDSAFYYYAMADSICENDPMLKVSRQHARVYNYLGYAVRVSHNYQKTEGFYIKAKTMYRELGHELGVQEVNIGLAQFYNRQEKYQEALPLINEAVAYNKQNGTTNSYTYAIIVRAYILLNMKKFDGAQKDFQEYYDIIFNSENEVLKRRATNYMAYFYKETGNYEKAIEFYNANIELCTAANDARYLTMAYQELIDIYKKLGNLELLSETYEAYNTLRDKIDQEEKERAIYELETKYQTQKKEQEILLLTEQNKLAQKEKRNQLILLSGLLLVMAFIGGVLYYAYKNKIATANKFRELDELKSRFFANISHEFRTPLTLIKSPVQNLQTELNSEAAKKQLNLIDQNANRMLVLVDQLLELSRLDAGKYKLVFKQEYPDLLLRAIIEPFEYQAKEKGLVFCCDFQCGENPVWLDRDIVEKIVSNLLFNAVKYTPTRKQVSIDAFIKDSSLQMSISNDVIDITQAELNSLFERFYQRKSTDQGTGIGLSLVKELVDLYRGELHVKVENEKLSFTIKLPTEKDQIEKTGVLLDQKAREPIALGTTEILSDEAPLLLIVEDNDDVRSLIKEALSSDFRIIEATDGDQGLEIAKAKVPDLIISDIMMPGMNGYELSQQIKQNEITSSIPIILLTAKAGDEAHLEALKSKADSYLTKPFNHEILRAKIKQILGEREKLRNRYSQELILKPKEITINTVDEKFLVKLQEILDIHMTDPEFTADNFSKETGMSRMQLHRKLKNLLGVSATEFLRNERLNVAMELLKKPGLSISEIAYSVGFNDADYFARCFKTRFGVTPSRFKEQLA